MSYFKNIKLFEIEKYICNVADIYAHISDTKHPETLLEHSTLSVKYIDFIIKEKKLEKILNNIENAVLSKSCAKAVINFYREIMINAIYLHDIGKINISFQGNKMKNTTFKDYKNLNSDHSPLSSVLYFDFYYEKLWALYDTNSISEEHFNILCYILCINSYVISKHHGYLNNMSDYINNTFMENIKRVFDDNMYMKVYKSNYNRKPFININSDEELLKLEIPINMYKRKKTGNAEVSYYIYSRFLFSLLTTCDFYATYEYSNGKEVENLGVFKNPDEFFDEFKKDGIYEGMKNHKDFLDGKVSISPFGEKDINKLRSEMCIEAVDTLLDNLSSNIFFLEAPTGSGKTITSINLTFNILTRCKGINKCLYGFPFNTLVEQTWASLLDGFKGVSDIESYITILNSTTAIKSLGKAKDLIDDDTDYEKSLLFHQFVHYPILLTSHIKVFDILFGVSRENMFPLVQLANSVIILDEIQAYKNSIWQEIMIFLEQYAELLNMKIIIMSATLPGINKFTKSDNSVYLIHDRDRYFNDNLFKKRVNIDFSLLDSKNIDHDLFFKVKESLSLNDENQGKTLVCFIKKESAKEFYFKSIEHYKDSDIEVYLLSGDTSRIDRKKIINNVKHNKNKVLLVATQVIEAGVDIDMDTGFKDISVLDSEEQFLGRINRSCRKSGCKAYFFNKDKADGIYRGDFRLNNKLTLSNLNMQEILRNKNFNLFYDIVLENIKIHKNEKSADYLNLARFFEEDVNYLDYVEIKERMKLIDSYEQETVFFNRAIALDDGTVLEGAKVWQELKRVTSNNLHEYAESRFNLSAVMEKVNYFTCNVAKWENEVHDKFGDMLYIEDGEKYFINGVLDVSRVDTADIS